MNLPFFVEEILRNGRIPEAGSILKLSLPAAEPRKILTPLCLGKYTKRQSNWLEISEAAESAVY